MDVFVVSACLYSIARVIPDDNLVFILLEVSKERKRVSEIETNALWGGSMDADRLKYDLANLTLGVIWTVGKVPYSDGKRIFMGRVDGK